MVGGHQGARGGEVEEPDLHQRVPAAGQEEDDGDAGRAERGEHVVAVDQAAARDAVLLPALAVDVGVEGAHQRLDRLDAVRMRRGPGRAPRRRSSGRGGTGWKKASLVAMGSTAAARAQGLVPRHAGRRVGQEDVEVGRDVARRGLEDVGVAEGDAERGTPSPAAVAHPRAGSSGRPRCRPRGAAAARSIGSPRCSQRSQTGPVGPAVVGPALGVEGLRGGRRCRTRRPWRRSLRRPSIICRTMSLAPRQ